MRKTPPSDADPIDGAAISAEREDPEVTRARFVGALAELIDERGYAATTVVDIVALSHASKRTFYDCFANKQECFLALQQMTTDGLIAAIRAAIDEQAHWHDQVRQAIAAYVDSVRARPALALSWIRDLPAMGAEARAVQRRNFAELTAMLVQLSSNPGFGRGQITTITPAAATIVLGGLRELAAQSVEDEVDLTQLIEPAADAVIAILGRPDP